MQKLSVKERIVETASRLFYFQGYNQTGINQIIDEANVAKASMYQHFRSKEDIAVDYLQRRHAMWVGDLFAFVSKEEMNKGKIIASFDYLNEWLRRVDYRGCGFQNIITDLPKDQQKIKDQVLLHKNELRQWVHDLLEQEKEYTEKEAHQLGDEILILMEGAIILTQIQKDVWPIDSAKGACRKLLAL